MGIAGLGFPQRGNYPRQDWLESGRPVKRREDSVPGCEEARGHGGEEHRHDGRQPSRAKGVLQGHPEKLYQAAQTWRSGFQ